MDVVLIVEALTPAFGERFWQFIHDGGYQNRAKASGQPQFYRFDKPSETEFPSMISRPTSRNGRKPMKPRERIYRPFSNTSTPSTTQITDRPDR